MHPLCSLFSPRSIAVVGASSDPNKVGGRPIAFLKQAGFSGPVFPVSRAAAIQGLPAYASLAEIGAPIDQVIVAVPASEVLAQVKACVAARVQSVVVFSSGFGEGDAGADEARALRGVLETSSTRVLGPNSLGHFDVAGACFATFATALDGAWPRAGHVGVASQSGAFGSYFYAMAQRRGIGFSHVVATGNEADVDVADCIDFLASDEATKVIVAMIEGCRNGRKLVKALEAARSAGKPVLMMKVGTSQAGARAAATHTGSLTGADSVFAAVVSACGAGRADSLEALVDAVYLASTAPTPRSAIALVVTTSGGIGVLCADEAERTGLDLAPIPADAAAAVRDVVPLAAGNNPVDTSAAIVGDLSLFARIASLALASRPYGAVVLFLAHIARNPRHWAQLEPALFALRAAHADQPFIAILIADGETTTKLETAGFCVFEDPSRAMRAMGVIAHLRAFAGAGPGVGTTAGSAASTMALPRGIGDEAALKAALAKRGIKFPPERQVGDADQAAAAAASIGYPVVLKIVSPDIAHKTEVGGVALGLRDETSLRRAVVSMDTAVRAARPDARLEGFLVAKELRGGVEVLVGAQIDPSFGPVVTVGAGGTATELMRDTATALAPLDAHAARALLARTRVAKLLAGYRGAPACDMSALAEQIALLSRIAAASAETACAIELNPVLASPSGAFAVDAWLDPVKGSSS